MATKVLVTLPMRKCPSTRAAPAACVEVVVPSSTRIRADEAWRSTIQESGCPAGTATRDATSAKVLIITGSTPGTSAGTDHEDDHPVRWGKPHPRVVG
ncbi:hypothetical protein F4559_000682 [Saccharothrix violaceirubra]|uniref:Uncharacterized protein n=1 Tax=Saccharothrix violaceirubra TaxID=413306 RepID=A0A7W7SYP2_9PSEU|nr:hypothetical protein [Saccharothrix violaceirubra]